MEEIEQKDVHQTVPHIRVRWHLLKEDLIRDFVGTVRPRLIDYLYEHISGILVRHPDKMSIFTRLVNCKSISHNNDWMAVQTFMELDEDIVRDTLDYACDTPDLEANAETPVLSVDALARRLAEQYTDICFQCCHVDRHDGGMGIVSELTDFSAYGGISWDGCS